MKISINKHSSIRIEDGDKVLYFDPFQITDCLNDADLIFITHDHFDHFSIEDIRKVEKDDTVYVIPECMYNLLGGENVVTVLPGEKHIIEGYEVKVIPSYNVGKQFHPKDKGYVAYVVGIGGEKVFVAGDCDANEDNLKVKCDIALVPAGGMYTMNYAEAAAFVNRIHPKKAIPMHYGEVAGDQKDGERFAKLVDKDIEVEILL